MSKDTNNHDCITAHSENNNSAGIPTDTNAKIPANRSAGIPAGCTAGFKPAAFRNRGYLPHLEIEGSTYFVTFRLVDSLPLTVMQKYIHECDQAIKENKSRDKKQLRKIQIQYQKRIEKYFDTGYGACYLTDSRVADVVANAMGYFNSVRYRLFSWCIMPNHVHVVFMPIAGFGLQGILHSWKSYTSNRANEILGRTGGFWYREYYDRLIRNEKEFCNSIDYVVNNPNKAGLVDWEWVWFMEKDEPVAGRS